MKKLFNRKGFTMAELLIVVAIIAILAAIAIPTFSSQLNSSKIGTDHANIRSAYSQMRMAELTGEINGTVLTDGVSYYLQKDGSLAATGSNDYTMQGNEGVVDECSLEEDIGIEITGTHAAGAKLKITFTVSGDTVTGATMAFES